MSAIRGIRATVLHTVIALTLAVATVTMQGCGEDGTCMWNGDVMVKGCRHNWFFSWSSCIEKCSACFDECNKLKCAAYCAKASGDGECLSNYAALCASAVENVGRVGLCDVDCSAAKPRPGSRWGLATWAPLLVTAVPLLPDSSSSEPAGAAPAAPRRRRPWSAWAAASASLLLVACCLGGCATCENAAPQLPDFKPDNETLNRLANRVDGSGLWRGTGFHRDAPGYYESEQYRCINRTASEGGFCGAWHKREENCRESEFGKCLCVEASASKHFCQRWVCKDFQAGQFICDYPLHCESSGHGGISGSGTRRRAGRRLTGSRCWHTKRCKALPYRLNEQEYQLLESQSIKFEQNSSGDIMWAALVPDSSLRGSHAHELCLTSGKFEGSWDEQYHTQMSYCHGQRYFREMEEEMSSCSCQAASRDKKRCDRWTCDEYKSGQFGVLFERPPPNIEDLVEGMEVEHYHCESHSDGPCMEWSGQITSWNQAEITKCRCSAADCSKWLCDEYQIMAMQEWWHYPEIWSILGVVIYVVIAYLCALIGNRFWCGSAGLLVALLYLLRLTYHGLGCWGLLCMSSPALTWAALCWGTLVLAGGPPLGAWSKVHADATPLKPHPGGGARDCDCIPSESCSLLCACGQCDGRDGRCDCNPSDGDVLQPA